MKIGIISDSHDNLKKIDKAVKLFNRKKVGLVLHAGDIIAPFAIEHLEALKMPYEGIFGNNDGEKRGLAEKSKGRLKDGPLTLEIEGRKILLAHDCYSSEAIKSGGDADIWICGHTHKPDISRRSGKLFINPGECGGHLSGNATVALLDLEAMKAEIIRI